MRQTAYLVINPTSDDSYASLFNCGSGLELNDGLDIKFTSGFGLDAMSLAWPHRGSTCGFLYLWLAVGD